ncbi:hypothetical protein COU14_02705 [Candidatus Kaiserbacteria bacterium CG10_big_fil_rev_8_21_14_0_10_44_10]|uniref:Uncharacterized protein n=1 Tax=Candidatus Kaiserbacteria bacterium CG10_big_fil_rev_8_21_14_0_10_44_10 TaxID=1974606 RepID=A0A2H0UH65_9BACT|nr:MAG: hypothetical protein COU14_02705 [Candidatus Kaiserbacteria bacterium CG10_big_fil_rev_8_21_14_0_10_44_10]
MRQQTLKIELAGVSSASGTTQDLLRYFDVRKKIQKVYPASVRRLSTQKEHLVHFYPQGKNGDLTSNVCASKLLKEELPVGNSLDSKNAWSTLARRPGWCSY